LDDLVSIPQRFGLTICTGYVDKENYPFPLPPGESVSFSAHVLALIKCEMALERWMRENAPKEVALVTVENNTEVRAAAKETHLFYQDPVALEHAGFANHEYFPLVKIRDGLQFADKEECKLLQVADVCAWAVRLHFSKAPHAARFCGPFVNKCISVWPTTSGS
jgi:hypothetical protein